LFNKSDYKGMKETHVWMKLREEKDKSWEERCKRDERKREKVKEGNRREEGGEVKEER